jgi:hypothetical protein
MEEGTLSRVILPPAIGVPSSRQATPSSRVAETQWRAVSTRFGAMSVPVH